MKLHTQMKSLNLYDVEKNGENVGVPAVYNKLTDSLISSYYQNCVDFIILWAISYTTKQ